MRNDLTTDESRQFITGLAAFAKPILVLSGGEPLFRPDIFQIAKHAGECGLTVALATNGTLIITGQNTFSGGFTLQQNTGTLDLRSSTTLSGSQIVSGQIVKIHRTGDGTLQKAADAK